MPRQTISVIRGQLSGDAARDTATSRAILQQVTSGELGETLQVGMPHKVMAFGKHDTLADGFPDAVAIATNAGYDPTVRIAGGRAVVFSPTIVRFAWTVRAVDPATSMHARFGTLSESVVQTLARFGVPSSVGELPLEYCAGQYSVHLDGGGKVMGVGQRLTRNAAQVGGMIVVSDPDDINDVLVPVYAALALPMDPKATGSISDIKEIAPSDLIDAFVAELSGSRSVVEDQLDEATVTLATSIRTMHVPQVVA